MHCATRVALCNGPASGVRGAKTEVAPVEAGIEMWGTLLLTAAAITAYATERISIELTSLGTLGALMLLFHAGALWTGEPILDDADLLRDFASPALIAVSALLVVGQAWSAPAPWKASHGS